MQYLMMEMSQLTSIYQARRNLIRVLNRLPQTMLIATHDLSFAAEVCPRAAVLSRGKLTAEKPTEEIDEDFIS